MSTGFTTSKIRPTTAIEVLEAVVAKLRNGVEQFNSETTCFITATPEPSVEVSDNIFATVTFMGGPFDQPIMDGSGNQGVVQLASIVIAVWSRVELDQIERFSIGDTDPALGLLSLMKDVLAALAGRNLDGGTYQAASSVLLLEPMYPSRSQPSQPRQVDSFAGFTIPFDCKFWWNLGTVSSLT